MKTYTFADSTAPASAHMAGLKRLLVKWAEQASNESANARNKKQQEFHFGRSEGYREVIALIEDSNSI